MPSFVMPRSPEWARKPQRHCAQRYHSVLVSIALSFTSAQHKTKTRPKPGFFYQPRLAAQQDRALRAPVRLLSWLRVL